MRSTLVLVLLALSTTVQAEHAFVPRAESVRDLSTVAAPPSETGGKLDLPAELLLLPLFEVNKNNPAAETTLFSVRNTSSTTVADIFVDYYTASGIEQLNTSHTLNPRQTLSINVNDVDGLAVNGNGIARGYAVIGSQLLGGSRQPEKLVGSAGKGLIILQPTVLVGDYFQVIQDQDFATGDRLATLDTGSVEDLCSRVEARFLNGGAFSGGTDFLFFVDAPQGGDPNTDPPSAVVNVIDEAGVLVRTADFYTSNVVTKLPISDITGAAFGTLEIAFSGTTGFVAVAYNALGRFSVGMDAVCKDRYAGDF